MSKDDNATKFLNVDLDVVSMEDLKPLAVALGEKVCVMRLGRRGKRKWDVHFELPGQPKNPDEAIKGFIKLLERLPRSACGI
jgi:hypothetical protein